MEKLYEYLPRELVTFVLVTLFSLLIGLSQRKISLKREGETTLFGTDRTFTFIGILGYLLYILDPVEYRLFMGGGAILGLLLGLNYYVKQSQFHVFGVTTIIIALITYCIAPIVDTQPSWFYVMVVVTVLLFTELKHTFTELAQRMKNDEMITLAKFLAISGIILPMLPNENLIPDINLTPYTVWLATVVVSGISYLSYLLRRYVFHESGILVSGIIGGLYSSTATISVLARKSRKAPAQEAPTSGGSGDDEIFYQLMESYKNRLTPDKRAFIGMAQGDVKDDLLTVYCSTEVQKSMLDQKVVTDVLSEVTSRAVGREIRVRFLVGERPGAKKRDKMQDLLRMGSKFDNFTVK